MTRGAPITRSGAQSRSQRYSIDDIHNRVGDLADFIGRRYGVAVGSRSGADTSIECPAHRPGHTTSATVHRWPDGQTFHCWRCDLGPVDVIDLLVVLGEVPGRADSIRVLGDELSAATETFDRDRAPMPRPRPRPPTKRVDPIELPEPVDSIEAHEVLADYLEWRDWSTGIADHYGLHAVEHRNGWRIRHPLMSANGDTLGAQDYARDLDPRWWTPKGTKLTLFGQQNLGNIGELGLLDVTEGLSDAVTVSAALGADHPVVGLPGAAGWVSQYSAGLSRAELVVWPDNDDAGRRFAEKITKVHNSFGGRVCIGQVPVQYNDLAEWRADSRTTFAGDFRVARFDAWKAAQ